MKKYYDLPNERLVAMLEWNKGYGTLEEAKSYFKSECREISKNEFERLGKEYCSGSSTVEKDEQISLHYK